MLTACTTETGQTYMTESDSTLDFSIVLKQDTRNKVTAYARVKNKTTAPVCFAKLDGFELYSYYNPQHTPPGALIVRDDILASLPPEPAESTKNDDPQEVTLKFGQLPAHDELSYKKQFDFKNYAKGMSVYGRASPTNEQKGFVIAFTFTRSDCEKISSDMQISLSEYRREKVVLSNYFIIRSPVYFPENSD